MIYLNYFRKYVLPLFLNFMTTAAIGQPPVVVVDPLGCSSWAPEGSNSELDVCEPTFLDSIMDELQKVFEDAVPEPGGAINPSVYELNSPMGVVPVMYLGSARFNARNAILSAVLVASLLNFTAAVQASTPSQTTAKSAATSQPLKDIKLKIKDDNVKLNTLLVQFKKANRKNFAPKTEAHHLQSYKSLIASPFTVHHGEVNGSRMREILKHGVAVVGKLGRPAVFVIDFKPEDKIYLIFDPTRTPSKKFVPEDVFIKAFETQAGSGIINVAYALPQGVKINPLTRQAPAPSTSKSPSPVAPSPKAPNSNVQEVVYQSASAPKVTAPVELEKNVTYVTSSEVSLVDPNNKPSGKSLPEKTVVVYESTPADHLQVLGLVDTSSWKSLSEILPTSGAQQNAGFWVHKESIITSNNDTDPNTYKPLGLTGAVTKVYTQPSLQQKAITQLNPGVILIYTQPDTQSEWYSVEFVATRITPVNDLLYIKRSNTSATLVENTPSSSETAQELTNLICGFLNGIFGNNFNSQACQNFMNNLQEYE